MARKPTIISGIDLFGDSLTDTGVMYRKKLFDIIKMRKLAGLDASPRGAFTNGRPWSEVLADCLLHEVKSIKKIMIV